MAAATAQKIANTNTSNDTNTNVTEAELAQRLNTVQTLLFGDAQSATSDRIAFLEDRVLELESSTDDRFEKLAKAADERFAAMEKEFEQRLAQMEKDINVRDRQQTQSRRRLVANLGDTIKLMAKEN